MMFTKILVANRGEIACRVIKTARTMGIKTVAVYSDADRHALHVKMADEAVNIGPSPSAQSYLMIDTIVAAAKSTGAQAVHPGYGFLSENARFAEALDKAGIVFIGPPVKAIEAMGDKIASKKIAMEAGVSTVPGFIGLIEDEAHAVKIAREIGYPVMIKASAGGGGKGMRVAHTDAEAREGFSLSKSEAKSSFGDDRIFVEKFVTDPRHIEIQLIGDQHGTLLYLNERECSVQRRNQKVIEEAPSPFLNAATRKAMGEQAVALARAVEYFSAGTVEFIVDSKRTFYFLEMNTRLQVEHPVTELITGLDLVELMILVAAGERLPLAQKDVRQTGWAIESRIYAEDPYRNFLPSIGRLTRYRPPKEGERSDGTILRNDTGVYEGGSISVFYDPMIAKLCSWGKDRATAVAAMADALDEFDLEGVGNNLPFLSAVMGQKRFQDGALTTGYIAEEFPDGFAGTDLQQSDVEDLARIAAFLHVTREMRAASVSGALPNHHRKFGATWVVTMNGTTSNVMVERHAAGQAISVDGGPVEVVSSDWTPGQTLGHFRFARRELTVKISPTGSGFRLRRRGMDVVAVVRSTRVAELAKLMPIKTVKDTSNLLLCPMPGVLRSITVAAGERVEAGQALAIVEAMKMENVLRAGNSGTIKRVAAKAGDSLAVDQLIMEFE